MSAFSDVDNAPDPERLISFLDYFARAERGMKLYAASVLTVDAPVLPILDVGCGSGHDLALLASAGARAVGVDASARMLERAKRRVDGRLAVLVRATGERLPFRDHAFGGCRMERLLMHVTDPAAVIAEAVRCLTPGAQLTLCEPDWSSLRVRAAHGDDNVGWITSSRHPGVGGDLGGSPRRPVARCSTGSKNCRSGAAWRYWTASLAGSIRRSPGQPWRDE